MQCLAEIKSLNKGADVDSMNRRMDDDEKYGMHIAAEMRKITDEVTKQLVKSEVQTIFLKAHTGQLKPFQQGANIDLQARIPLISLFGQISNGSSLPTITATKPTGEVD